MVSGLPDWYRGVDIAYQALAQIITRPTYGGAIGTSGNQVVTANSTTTLVSVSGQGMIYGGYVALNPTASQSSDSVQVELDGNVIFDFIFSYLSGYKIAEPRSSPLVILEYDNSNYIYSVGLSYGLTFESSLVLKYKETKGNTPNVYYNVIYGLV